MDGAPSRIANLFFASDSQSIRDKTIPTPAAYLLFDQTNRCLAVAGQLSDRPGVTEIPTADLYQRHSGHLRSAYIEFIARLNKANGDMDWWTHDISTKNMLATNLGQNMFRSWLVAEAMTKQSLASLVIISEDRDLLALLRGVAKERGATFIDVARSENPVRRLTEYLPVYLVLYFFRTLYRRARMKRTLSPPASGPTIVFASLISGQSFTANGYQDVYFDKLVDQASERGEKVLVFGKFMGRYPENLDAIAATGRADLFPIEYFLGVGDVVACFARSLANFLRGPRFAGETRFEGVEVGPLIRRCLRRDNSRNYFTNLLFYYCARGLAHSVAIKAFTYPFENRAFEKMYLVAMAEAGVRTIGYNHASVTLKHTNMFLGEDENEVIPLPDRVVTMGEVSRSILTEEGGVPADKISVGCGLRQAVPQAREMRTRPKMIRNILLVLTAEVEEYVGMLAFLNRAFPDGSRNYQINIRPHPVTPLASALDRLDLTFDYKEVGGASLSNNLSEADVVLYTSSTVAVEALAAGIPVIYLDFGDIIINDPLFALDTFKWSVGDPTMLPAILREIESLSQDDYATTQEAGRAYAARYILPATPDNLERFVDLIEGVAN